MMEYQHMDIDNRTDLIDFSIDENRLHSISENILTHYFDTIPELSLSFITPREIQELNKTYRGYDEVTDVLTFPSDGEVDPETGKEYLGDILICVSRASEQAASSNHPLQNEIELLLIHGLLHLLGYDHSDESQKEEMWALQNEYLDLFNINLGRKPGEDLGY